MSTYYFGDWSAEIYLKLAVIPELIDALPGGIYLFRNLPENLDRETMPSIYGPNGLILPHLIVRGRDALAQPAVRSMNKNNKFVVATQVVEVWFYANQFVGWESLNPAAKIVFDALEQEKVEDAWNIELVGQINSSREQDLGDAAFLMHEYMVVGKL